MRLVLIGCCCFVAAKFADAQPPAVPNAIPGSPRWFFGAVPAEPPVDLTSSAGQQYVQALAALGREDLVSGLAGRVARPGECEGMSSNAGSIVEHLAELAKSTRVVIINEAHDEPRHRELTRQLAIALRREGYTHFAAEAFASSADRNPAERFGRIDAGYYASEPAFGRLIRTVKELGYELVSYEHSASAEDGANADRTAAIAAREEGQANNLIARIFAEDWRTKALIHVGHSHAAEVPIPSFNESMQWMAARLKAKTGIDPLTVDQTYCASPSGDLNLTAPTALMPAGAFDVAVAYPSPVLFRGRPQWRIDSGAIAIELPATLVSEQRTIIEARYADEPFDAIPVDRLLLRARESVPLLLPAGRIRLLQLYEDGTPPRSSIMDVQ
jgi:hypothetical protein